MEADLRGISSHGVNRLDMYLQEVEDGVVHGHAEPTTQHQDDVAVARVDGHNAPGPVVGVYSMQLAIAKAQRFGISFVTANHSNHYGIAAYYAMMASREGLIGLSCTNTSPLLVPTRARESALGTNPIAFTTPEATPRGEQEKPLSLQTQGVQLDMATTAVPIGKVEFHHRKGERIPAGWAVDGTGHTTQDPAAVLESGGLYPLGGAEETAGYKGYGLAMMVEILCGVLGDAKYGTDVEPWRKGRQNEANVAHCFAALDPQKFAPGFGERVVHLVQQMKSLQTSADDAVLVPGEKELHLAQDYHEHGIALHPTLYSNLCEIAERYHLVPPPSLP